MRYKNVLIGFILLFSPAIVNAQSPTMASPFVHAKKVYVDQKSKIIYWPISIPFYIRLAVSEEEGASSYLLQNTSGSSSTNLSEHVVRGVKIEMSGPQFIRWYNCATKDTVLFKFFADGDAPNSTANMSGAAKYVAGDKVIYGRGLKCTISSEDSMVGVKDTYVSIDGRGFEPYRTELYFDQEKDYNLRFYAVDLVGNASSPKELKFTIDLTPPVTKHKILGHVIENILSPQNTIRLNSFDELAGVKRTYYKFDSQNEYSVYLGSPIKLNKLSNGTHKLIYYSEDHVNNVEDTSSYRFYIDTIPPTVNILIDGDKYHSTKKVYVSAQSQVKLKATDNKIGVDRIEYAINSKDFQTYTKPFTLQANRSNYEIVYRAIDKLGNISNPRRWILNMDVTAPQSSIKFIGVSYEQRSIVWITSKTKISLSSHDDKSGVKNIKYQIGFDQEKNYSGPFSLDKEGKYELKFWSVDNVNNSEAKQKLRIVVDNTPPSIIVNFSVASIDTTKSNDGSILEVFPCNTSIFLGATDASASSEGIWYSINGRSEKKYKTPLTFRKEGNYKLIIRSRDRVNNESIKIVSFLIKD